MRLTVTLFFFSPSGGAWRFNQGYVRASRLCLAFAEKNSGDNTAGGCQVFSANPTAWRTDSLSTTAVFEDSFCKSSMGIVSCQAPGEKIARLNWFFRAGASHFRGFFRAPW